MTKYIVFPIFFNCGINFEHDFISDYNCAKSLQFSGINEYISCFIGWKLPNGKKASLAKAAPLTSSPAFLKAIRKLSTRFGWPLPIPNIQLFCPNDKDQIIFFKSSSQLLENYFIQGKKNQEKQPSLSQWRYF